MISLRGRAPKEVKIPPPANSFDLWSFPGFNVGSLLRIPQAQLLSGTERLGSLKERKGDREMLECWATVERSKTKNGFYRKTVPQIALCGD
jgi:hypothetical protein